MYCSYLAPHDLPLFVFVLELFHKQSKSTKHWITFLSHCMYVWSYGSLWSLSELMSYCSNSIKTCPVTRDEARLHRISITATSISSIHWQTSVKTSNANNSMYPSAAQQYPDHAIVSSTMLINLDWNHCSIHPHRNTTVTQKSDSMFGAFWLFVE